MTEVVTENPPSIGRATTSRRYCLITPCRDEAAYARRTLDSIVNQTVLPALWVIVDDGSTDGTSEIIREYAEKYSWIKIVTRSNRSERKVGGGVVDAFNEGYQTINSDDFEYVCKLDLDLEIPAVYFQRMIERMESNPRLSSCSGKPYMQYHGRLISEKCGDENSVGMIKFYRVSAYKQMGGFVRMVMWDGIDCHRCRMLGWQTGSWDDAETRFVHLRPMGTSHKNWWTGRARHGAGQYFMGTGLIYMLASCLFRIFHPPMILGSIAMMWGWIKSFITRAPRYDDPQFRSFLHHYHRLCLIHGKKYAIDRLDHIYSNRWKQN